MKILKKVLVSILAVFIFACGASQEIKEPNAKLDRMMVQKSFKIIVKTAEPQVTQALSQVANSGMLPPGNTISRIDVTGDGYFIKVQGDSVSANLPYYGERQMGGGYDSDSGIKFDGLTKNLKLIKDETKQRYLVNFSIDSSSENYFVTVALGNNLGSRTSIRSSHRNRIRYTGDVEALEIKD